MNIGIGYHYFGFLSKSLKNNRSKSILQRAGKTCVGSHRPQFLTKKVTLGLGHENWDFSSIRFINNFTLNTSTCKILNTCICIKAVTVSENEIKINPFFIITKMRILNLWFVLGEFGKLSNKSISLNLKHPFNFRSISSILHIYWFRKL